MSDIETSRRGDEAQRLQDAQICSNCGSTAFEEDEAMEIMVCRICKVVATASRLEIDDDEDERFAKQGPMQFSDRNRGFDRLTKEQREIAAEQRRINELAAMNDEERYEDYQKEVAEHVRRSYELRWLNVMFILLEMRDVVAGVVGLPVSRLAPIVEKLWFQYKELVRNFELMNIEHLHEPCKTRSNSTVRKAESFLQTDVHARLALKDVSEEEEEEDTLGPVFEEYDYDEGEAPEEEVLGKSPYETGPEMDKELQKVHESLYGKPDGKKAGKKARKKARGEDGEELGKTSRDLPEESDVRIKLQEKLFQATATERSRFCTPYTAEKDHKVAQESLKPTRMKPTSSVPNEEGAATEAEAEEDLDELHLLPPPQADPATLLAILWLSLAKCGVAVIPADVSFWYQWGPLQQFNERLHETITLDDCWWYRRYPKRCPSSKDVEDVSQKLVGLGLPFVPALRCADTYLARAMEVIIGASAYSLNQKEALWRQANKILGMLNMYGLPVHFSLEDVLRPGEESDEDDEYRVRKARDDRDGQALQRRLYGNMWRGPRAEVMACIAVLAASMYYAAPQRRHAFISQLIDWGSSPEAEEPVFEYNPRRRPWGKRMRRLHSVTAAAKQLRLKKKTKQPSTKSAAQVSQERRRREILSRNQRRGPTGRRTTRPRQPKRRPVSQKRKVTLSPRTYFWPEKVKAKKQKPMAEESQSPAEKESQSPAEKEAQLPTCQRSPEVPRERMRQLARNFIELVKRDEALDKDGWKPAERYVEDRLWIEQKSDQRYGKRSKKETSRKRQLQVKKAAQAEIISISEMPKQKTSKEMAKNYQLKLGEECLARLEERMQKYKEKSQEDISEEELEKLTRKISRHEKVIRVIRDRLKMANLHSLTSDDKNMEMQTCEGPLSAYYALWQDLAEEEEEDGLGTESRPEANLSSIEMHKEEIFSDRKKSKGSRRKRGMTDTDGGTDSEDSGAFSEEVSEAEFEFEEIQKHLVADLEADSDADVTPRWEEEKGGTDDWEEDKGGALEEAMDDFETSGEESVDGSQVETKRKQQFLRAVTEYTKNVDEQIGLISIYEEARLFRTAARFLFGKLDIVKLTQQANRLKVETEATLAAVLQEETRVFEQAVLDFDGIEEFARLPGFTSPVRRDGLSRVLTQWMAVKDSQAFTEACKQADYRIDGQESWGLAWDGLYQREPLGWRDGS